jgi:hypothetical protein
LDPAADYGRASFDVRHSGVLNVNYDLPFDSNQKSDRRWTESVL